MFTLYVGYSILNWSRLGFASSAVLAALYANSKKASEVSQGITYSIYGIPDDVVRDNKQNIMRSASKHGVPPDLLAAVLLSELNDFDFDDALGDSVTLWKAEEHSIGIAQLQIEDCRHWNLYVPEFGPNPPTSAPAWKIRDALENQALSIDLLAQAIKYFAKMGPTANHAALGLVANTSYDFANWANATPIQRHFLAWLFTGAKDDIEGRMVGGTQQGGEMYDRVLERKLLQ